MRPVYEQERLEQVVAKARRLTDELKIGSDEFRALGPLSAGRMDAFSPQERTVLLAFLKRFENAVEAGRRLFRAALTLAGEDVVDMSTREVFDAAERERVLGSAQGWRDVVRVRNVVAHEYAMSPQEAAIALESARTAATSAVALLEGTLATLAEPPFSDGDG